MVSETLRYFEIPHDCRKKALTCEIAPRRMEQGVKLIKKITEC